MNTIVDWPNSFTETESLVEMFAGNVPELGAV